MTRITFAALLVAMGAFFGGCKSDDHRRADATYDDRPQTTYDARTGTHLDSDVYIDSRNVKPSSAPASTGFTQDNYWSEDEEPSRGIYATPRDTDPSNSR